MSPTFALTDPQPVSSPDLIFNEIVQGLYKGIYVPGQRLVEADLTLRFGVSRGTVREALNRLAADGIVVLHRNRGAGIRELSRGEMLDILVVLEMMHGLAAKLAALHIDQGTNRQRFLESYKALLDYRRKPESFEFLQARNRFYRTMATIGENEELRKLLNKTHLYLLRVQLRTLSLGYPTERFQDYVSTGEAILSGHARRAELAASKHVRASINLLMSSEADGRP